MTIKKLKKQFSADRWYALCDKHKEEALTQCGGGFMPIEADEAITQCEFKDCKRQVKWEYYPKRFGSKE